jgi:uracil-DNA glycosylase family 4
MTTQLKKELTAQRSTANEQLPRWLNILRREVISCTRCPRLVAYREQIAREKRRAYRDCEYWGKPVPGFGDPEARVLVMGLAPGAHGSNRTGRPFTGDASGKFMYPVLYETGFANQTTATDRNDGLKLTDLYITAAVRCAPPDNKPMPQELANCSQFLDRELTGLERVKVVVALGKIGFDAYLNYVKRGLEAVSQSSAKNAKEWADRTKNTKEPVLSLSKGTSANFRRADYLFKHGASYWLPNGKVLLASYHPSNQNTQTGKLTREMFVAIFKEAAKLADE